MADALTRLDAALGDVVDLRHTASLLSWDERVCMPPGGAAAHGEMLATVRRLAHEKFTSDEVGLLLDAAKAELNGISADAPAARKVAIIDRDYRKATRVPAEHVAELARASSAAHEAWRQARSASDFQPFAPHLERLVALKRQYVEFFEPLDHPYDALLDDFEPGARTADVQKIFDALRPVQVALIREIAERPAPDDAFLYGSFAEPQVLQFALGVVSAFGFDWSRGRQDKSAHPFATSIGLDDVRITTRFDERHPFEMLFSMLHETGHGLYEQGVDPHWARTILRGGASLGVHESQSRLWENVIGRSRAFWGHFFPRLRERFPSQLGDVTLERFYRAINRVQPSLVRVEADEVTYNLHVMLRVELEVALLTGEVGVGDLPGLWNTKMREYLGVTPATVAEGILQDMHWSVGLFGYFATYTIGNLISVQLWEKYCAIEPEHERQIGSGEFSTLREWLRTEIHQHGRSYEPGEIVARVTGSAIDPGPYLGYLQRKYSDIYGLTG